MTSVYMDNQKNRQLYKDLKEQAAFGLIGGLLLVTYGFLGYLKSNGVTDVIYISMLALGSLLIIFGIIMPSILYFPSKWFQALGNLIGKTIFSVLLIIVYFAMIVPASLIMRNKKQDCNFLSWDENDNLEKLGFVEKERYDEGKEKLDANKSSIAKSAYKIIGYFISHKNYIMIPTLLLLLILGLVLFFVSSTVVAPFIYTMF